MVEGRCTVLYDHDHCTELTLMYDMDPNMPERLLRP
jgi:hypothetical protein